MTEEKELEMWREEWATLGGSDTLIAELAAQAARDARRIRLSNAGEVLAAIFSSSVSLMFAIGSHGKPTTVVLCAGIFLFNGVWLTRLLTLRIATETSAIDDFIAHRRRSFERDLTWNAFARRATLVLAIACVPWSAWMLHAGADFYNAAPWRGVIGFGGIIVILTIVLFGLKRKRAAIAAESERFETLIAERTMV